MNHSSHEQLSESTNSVVLPWLQLLVTPTTSTVEPSLLLSPSVTASVRALLWWRSQLYLSLSCQLSRSLYLGGCVGVEAVSELEQAAFAARISAAK